MKSVFFEINRRALPGLLIAVASLLCASCSSDDECDENDVAYCSGDAKSIRHCRQGKWTAIYCNEGSVCGYINGTQPDCFALQNAETAHCTPNDKKCAGSTIAMTCQDNGSWRYDICDENASCQNGECKSAQTPVEPDKPNKGIAKRQCTDDAKGIETIDALGNKTTQSCLDMTGFETTCKTYAGGLVGCEAPKKCDDTVFTEAGTCHGNLLRTCDTRYIEPQAVSQDCSFISDICATLHGKSQCFKECSAENADKSNISCDGNTATRCVSLDDGKAVTETAASLCLDEKTQATCDNGTLKTTTCDENASCLDETGTCVETCTQADLYATQCRSDGTLWICQPIGNGYGYVSVGTRECMDDTLVTCQKNSETGEYVTKSTNCLEYTHTDGKVYKAHCQKDYQYEGMDVCVPIADGEPCNGLTNEGVCDGNTLRYCIEEDDIASVSNCSNNSDGYTVCSVFSSFADCRKPCSTKGSASCYVDTKTQTYAVSLCAPSQNSDTLTLIEGTALCLNNYLYSCAENGKTTVVDCSATGGICDTNACVYPACGPQQSPVCTAENALISCQIDETGTLLGTTLQSVACSPDGNCMQCINGELQSLNP